MAKRGYGAFPPMVRCVCGCFGAEHETVWKQRRWRFWKVEVEFGGTRCSGGHRGHKFEPEVADG